jgi:hypothetical protein
MNLAGGGHPGRRAAVSLAGAAMMAVLCNDAAAFKFDMENPDIKMRWDNTLRYNLGMRAEGRDRTLGDTWTLQAGEYKFDRGEIVTNRLDVLSELDFIFKDNYGFRVSGAAWYDAAYDDDVKGNPAYQSAGLGTAYPGNKYTDTVKRYYTHSGELLDAFVFGRLNLGSSPLDVRIGRHNIYWGESLFTPIHGVSYSQGPVDFRKATANPGTEAKELFLPLNQISAALQINETYSLAAQYYLQWEPYRIYEGGTYFTFADPVFQRGTFFSPNGGLPYRGDVNSGPDAVPDNTGDWGVKGTGAFDFGTVGLYYRRFDDKVPSLLSTGGTFSELHNAYAKDVKLWGISLSKLLGSVSFGAELVHRQDTALNTQTGSPEIARGNTWHALANATSVIGETPLFDSAVLLAELTYSKLDSVKKGSKAFFKHVDHICRNAQGVQGGDEKDGCSTDDAWGLSLKFTPTWYQVFPSVDLSMPMSYSRGLKGNSPVPFGGNENSGSWSVGLTADYKAKYNFSLSYIDYYGDYTERATPAAFAVPGIGNSVLGSNNGGNALIHDRGWLSFTFKTAF